MVVTQADELRCTCPVQVPARRAVRGRVPQAHQDVQRRPPPQDRAEVPAAGARSHARQVPLHLAQVSVHWCTILRDDPVLAATHDACTRLCYHSSCRAGCIERHCLLTLTVPARPPGNIQKRESVTCSFSLLTFRSRCSSMDCSQAAPQFATASIVSCMKFSD